MRGWAGVGYAAYEWGNHNRVAWYHDDPLDKRLVNSIILQMQKTV